MNLRFITIGKVDSTPLIFLHGFLGSGKDWLPIAGQLQDDCYSISPDLPGHGGSAAIGENTTYDMESVAAAVVRLTKRVKMKRSILIGYSMGGRIALYTALKYWQRFSGLILESASPGLVTATEREERQALDDQRAAELIELGTKQFVRNWYEADLFKSLHNITEKRRELIKRRSSGDPRRLATALRYLSVGRQPSLWDKLDQLQLPVLLVVGELDNKFNRINREMAQRMSTAKLVSIENAGHNTHFDQPDKFLRHLREYIGSLASVRE
ncbi:MAG: 2-succinyl-6-hydroxy-2,4-cyclohexadiene-1-carboxylate synthase [candidate division Zixibacteria bacterium]|nr:2-succinyl-6-hydroxy-2,4-cyclohexadiene-1-carboxylate synthase [candidate division Zixibacteria bacterium]